MPSESSNLGSPESPANGNKRSHANALELGPRKRPCVGSLWILSLTECFLRTTQDPLVHHGRHFGRIVHAFCNIQTLIMNGIATLGETETETLESFTTQ